MYKIRSKEVKQLNQAIKDVGKLNQEGIKAEALAVGIGIYAAVLLKEYKTEKGARDYIEKYEGKLDLDVIMPVLKIKD